MTQSKSDGINREDVRSAHLSTASSKAPVTTAGRELDALVAVKVFGWSEERKADYPPNSERAAANCWHRPLIAAPCSLPHFSTDISAAWLVVEKVDNRNAVAKEMGVLTMGLSRYDNGYTARFFNSGATADTAPLAICLAALKAVGA